MADVIDSKAAPDIKIAASGFMFGVAKADFAIAALFFIYAAGFIDGAVGFFHSFPDIHTWGELLTNYAGGFFKRSLLGEILLLTNATVSAKYTATAIVLVVYLIILAWTFHAARRHLSLAWALFLASPAGLLFPLHDPLAYGRKDIFIVTAFIASIEIIQRARSDTRALISIMLLYLAAGLMIEVAWCYFPLAFMFLVVVRKPPLRWQAAALFASVIYLAACYPLATAYPTPPPDRAVIQSWIRIAPNVNQNVFCCMRLSLRESLAHGLHWGQMLFWPYALGFVLALIPIGVMVGTKPPRIGRLELVAISIALLCGLAPMVLAADLGRYIYLFTFQVFLFMAMIGKNRPYPNLRPWELGLAALYGGSWIMHHFPRGWPVNDGLMPGVLLRPFVG
jgi:hypothetical protein